MRAFHRVSAIFLLAFIFVHIGNHVAAAFGIQTYNAYLATARTYYRHAWVEPVLMLLIIFQAVTGFNLLIHSFLEGKKRSFCRMVGTSLNRGICVLYRNSLNVDCCDQILL